MVPLPMTHLVLMSFHCYLDLNTAAQNTFAKRNHYYCNNATT